MKTRLSASLLYDGAVTDLFQHGGQDLAEDARLLLLEIDRETPGAAAVTADCRPPLDVLETPGSVEVVVDLPGVLTDSLRVAMRRSTLLILGAKPMGPQTVNARFHLAERSYGRFARAVRVVGAFDGAGARAVVDAGQLRITLPLLQDRRGRMFTISVQAQ